MLQIIIALIISYLVGSIPTAFLFGRWLKKIDIREHGSGNVGATNALRVLGKEAGISVLCLDILKGLLPVVFIGDKLLLKNIPLSSEIARILLGIFCISGHNWTIFLKFKGGKGIATTLGVLLGLCFRIKGLWPVLGLSLITWLFTFALTGIVSLGSVTMGILLPFYMWIFKLSQTLLISSFLLALFILLRHKENLKRVFQGKEKRLF
jgi:glycerol-3-phosphate acyltransferase PlsY